MKRNKRSSNGRRDRVKKALGGRGAASGERSGFEIEGRRGRRAEKDRRSGNCSEISAPLPVQSAPMEPMTYEKDSSVSGRAAEAKPKQGGRGLFLLSALLPTLGASVLILSIFLLRAVPEPRSEAEETPANVDVSAEAEQVSGMDWALWYAQCVPSAVTVLCDHRGEVTRCGGFVLREDGYIATLLQEVRDAESIRVRLSDGRQLAAELIASDPLSELALLRIPVGDLKAAEVDLDAKPTVGRELMALVSSADGGAARMILGRPSAYDRQVVFTDEDEIAIKRMHLLPTDISMSESDGGSPLFDGNGRLVGMLLRAGEEGNVGYAVSIGDAAPILRCMLEGNRVTDVIRAPLVTEAPTVGVMAQSEEGGVRVMGFSHTAATLGGLREGDLITHVNGIAVCNLAELNEAVLAADWKEAVMITVLRGGQRLSFSVCFS